MDLAGFDSDVAWPIFDALIYWCVSKCADATDALQPGVLSPRSVEMMKFSLWNSSKFNPTEFLSALCGHMKTAITNFIELHKV